MPVKVAMGSAGSPLVDHSQELRLCSRAEPPILRASPPEISGLFETRQRLDFLDACYRICFVERADCDDF